MVPGVPASGDIDACWLRVARVTVARQARSVDDGTSRADVDYIWPNNLTQTARPPQLVYLDLNHWISLAKVAAGHPGGGKYLEASQECFRASERGAAIFPLSETIYFEVSKIRAHRQRRDLREVMERLSGFQVVASRTVIATLEVEALLDMIVGPSPTPVTRASYLDWGVARAFGMVGGFQVRDQSGVDVSAEARAAHPKGPEAFDALLQQAEIDLNRRSLEGPASGEEAELRNSGWNPQAAFEVAEKRAQQEVEQVARFDSDERWRRGRIRDVISAREVIIEINDPLSEGLARRNAALEQAFPTPLDMRRAIDAMPSTDVAITLKTAYHQDANHRWTPNDIHDIDALAATLPYCDVVATDKAVATHVTRTGLADRLNSHIVSDLSGLADRLTLR